MPVATGQNIRIKYNFFRSDAGFIGKDPYRSPAAPAFAERIRLAFFIKRHHHHGRAYRRINRARCRKAVTLFQLNRIEMPCLEHTSGRLQSLSNSSCPIMIGTRPMSGSAAMWCKK